MNADEKFFAWLDGELAGAEAAEVEARVAADPGLVALAEQHRAMQARIGKALDTVAAAPVPERLRTAAAAPAAANVIDLDAERSRRFAALPQWAAIAATLVLGIFVGTLVPHGSGAPVEVRNGTIYASRDLDRALDTELASAPTGGPVRIGLTFRNAQGDICRSFTATAASGLACRDDGRWRVRGLFPTAEGQSSDYRMAAGMDPGLAALLDSTMAGEPMDSAQEAQARKSGWR